MDIEKFGREVFRIYGLAAAMREGWSKAYAFCSIKDHQGTRQFRCDGDSTLAQWDAFWEPIEHWLEHGKFAFDEDYPNRALFNSLMLAKPGAAAELNVFVEAKRVGDEDLDMYGWVNVRLFADRDHAIQYKLALIPET